MTAIDDAFNALFFGSGLWLGLSLMLIILFALLFKWKETGFVTLPITFLFGLEYFNRDLGIEALIVWAVMMFELIYLVKGLVEKGN